MLWSTKAKILIEDKVIFGPRVSIITGNHRYDIVGKYIADIKDFEKRDSDDEDVIIRKDCWIGANVTILKGVTIEEGCVVAAGSVVTKSTEKYGIYAGVPAKRIKDRFNEIDVERHRKMLNI